MGSFAADITKFVAKTNIKATDVLRKLALDGLRGVVMKTPVDTGRCRGSWRVAINQTDGSVLPDPGTSNHSEAERGSNGAAAASAAIALGSGVIGQAQFGVSIYVTNNLPYAPALEEGHSKQAPAGMLAVTFAELKNAISAAVATAGSGQGLAAS